ncbi:MULTISPECIES: ankyrin repeat domain-containing protein [unclassified Wolbachia]|uniref:ankyrin repeat domain-containing protein n=1 Tax=unclassified Wolbachia TaxID=2640676 RepID=UPI0007EEF36F|nr:MULTISPECIES: ankyrin repeat domain-containing protein [unclassified Wolbachia]
MASEEEFEGEAMIMIHASAEKNHLTTMKIFIEKWKWDLHARDINGRTPLHTAVAHGNLEMVKYLIKKRADVNAPDYSRDTPLHVAASPPVSRDSLEIEILKYLIKNGANLNARGRDNYTPLHIAVLCIGNSRGIITMKTLIEAGADVNIPNYNGDTALHTVNRMRHTSLEKLLIEAGADPNIKNKKGETCLNTKV